MHHIQSLPLRGKSYATLPTLCPFLLCLEGIDNALIRCVEFSRVPSNVAHSLRLMPQCPARSPPTTVRWADGNTHV